MYRVFTEKVSTSSNIYFGKTVRKYKDVTVKLCVAIYGGSMCFPVCHAANVNAAVHLLSHLFRHVTRDALQRRRSLCDELGTHWVTAGLWCDMNHYWQGVKLFTVFHLSVCKIFIHSIIILNICLTKHWCMPFCYGDIAIITW